jgi:hypothetical protein
VHRTIEERTPQLTALWESLGGQETPPLADRPLDGVTPDARTDDAEVIDLASRANVGFSPLYYFGDMSAYHDDHSRADCGLVGILARVTRDPEQIDRIFRASALYRPKWDSIRYADGRTYGEGVLSFVLKSANARKDGGWVPR